MTKKFNLGYLHEKLGNATHALSVGEVSPKERLDGAAAEFWPASMDAKEWPPKIREEFEAIVAALSAKEPRKPGDGRISATIAAMNRDEIATIVRRIYRLEAMVEESYGR